MKKKATKTKTKKTKSVSIKKDTLINLLQEKLNDSLPEGLAAYCPGNEEEDASRIKDWVSTGSDMLDLAISNRPYGGLPAGRLVELNGLEGTGKSLLAAHLIAETQKKGGYGVYLDTENSVFTEFWEAIGVDLNKVLIVPCSTVEQVFEKMESAITWFRKSDKDSTLTIIVDSIAAASTIQESAKDYAKDGYATEKAIIVSKAMRKITNLIGEEKVLVIFTNQLRQRLNAPQYGDQYISSSGKALQYHCSVRVRLSSVKTITDNKDSKKIIGNIVRASIQKNRMGPPRRTAEFYIFYDSGIANYMSWIRVLRENKIITQTGAWYIYKKDDGETWQFQTKTFVDTLESDSKLKEELYKKICDAVIMEYKKPNSTIFDDEDINITDENNDDNDDDV